jgi:hypothetical protein
VTAGGGGRATWAVRVFFALLFIPYTCVFPYVASCNNPNENVRLFETMAIVEQGTLRIDDIVERYGWVNDMARVPDRGGHGTHLFSVKGPAVSFAAVPLYWAFAHIAPRFGHPLPGLSSKPEVKAWWMRSSVLMLRVIVVQLPCFAFLVWFERWLRKTSDDPVLRLSAVAAMALGTNYLAYSLMFVSHSLAAATVFVAFAIITDELDRRLDRPGEDVQMPASRPFLVGLLAGLATMLDYHAFVFSLGLTIYALVVFRSRRAAVIYSLGGAIDAAVVMLYQWRCFGNPLTPGHRWAETEDFAAWHRQGLYGIGRPSWAVFRDLGIHQTFGFFTTSRFMGLAGLAIPMLLFAGWDDPARKRLRMVTSVWVAMMLALWIAISGAANWRGGWTVGPRFFVLGPPFFTFGALAAFEPFAQRSERARAFARGLFGGFAVAGACTLGLVSLVYNSVPEDIGHPFADFALPLARAGFVPHHAGELFGWTGVTFWYVAFGCGVGAAILAASLPGASRASPERPDTSGGQWRRSALRATVATIVVFSCVFAEFVDSRDGQPGPSSVELGKFPPAWEPPQRDFLTRLRMQAVAEGKQKPCMWRTLAERERTVGLLDQADVDLTRSACCPPRSPSRTQAAPSTSCSKR